MSHNITVEGGTSVRLKTAGKYCDRDIIVTAEGSTSGGGESATISGVDLHDRTSDLANTYLSNGVIRNYSGWKTTDFILFESGKFYVVYCSSSIDLKYCAKYDANKTYKNILSNISFAQTTKKTIPYILSGNGEYMRFSGTNAQINALEVYEVINLSWVW
jgi:hypothetical protein